VQGRISETELSGFDPVLIAKEDKISYSANPITAGVFQLYLLKGHILMEERFADCIHVLQSKVCILLQDMPTNISLHKRT
jgi:hypothetical protein